MKLSSLRDFMAVAERGSLRAAARHLDVAQPAITRSIQELEKELGVTLFERRARGVTLTPMGERFLRRSQSVQGELQRAQQELGQMRGDLQGQLRVALSGVPHMALLPNAMRSFRQRYPQVRLEIIDSLLPEVESGLKDGAIDCYVGSSHDEVSPDLEVEPLFETPCVIVARQGHPLSGTSSLGDLVHAGWVSTSIARSAQEELAPVFETHGLPPPRSVVHGRSALTFLFTVAYSDLLMMVPEQWTQAPMFRDVLQRLPVRERLPSRTIAIVRRSGMPLTPAAEYFCDMIRRAARHMDTLMA